MGHPLEKLFWVLFFHEGLIRNCQSSFGEIDMLKIQDDWGEQDTAAIIRGNKLPQEGTGPIRMMFFLGPVFPPEKNG